MNNTLKHWREAATLILAAGAQDRNEISKIQNLSQQVPPHAPKGTAFDYDVLLLKRSQKSGFVPNAFVFPGGLVDASDFSNDWLKIFDKYNQKPNFGLGLVKQNPGGRSPMFVTDRTKFGSLLPSEVAFRICAIRETFEECGILLVVPENSDVEDNQNITSISDQDPQVLGKWRREVQSNPFQFIQLCKEMRCVPNIWALHEWSNWLTPVLPNTSSIRRYDTAFYICCLLKKPLAIEDDKEVTSFKWWSPWEVLEEFKSQNIWLPPPQFYELSRLCVVPDIHELHRFSHRRALEGCEQWMPILVHAEDGMINVLPGDELYPDEPDYTGDKKMLYSTDKTIEDIMKDSVCCHRYLQHNGIAHLCVNMEQKYKHLTPLSTDQTQSAKPKSRM